MDRCPNCRARISGLDHCRRCGMDLDLLRKVEEVAEAHLALAFRHLIIGDAAAASAAVRRVMSLRSELLAEHLLAFAEGLPEQESGGAVSDKQCPGALPNEFYMTDW